MRWCQTTEQRQTVLYQASWGRCVSGRASSRPVKSLIHNDKDLETISKDLKTNEGTIYPKSMSAGSPPILLIRRQQSRFVATPSRY